LHELDGAQRAVQSNGASPRPNGTRRECAEELRFWRAMRPRETTAHSGDIGSGLLSAPAETKSSGFEAEHRRLCRSEKREVFDCPRGWLRSLSTTRQFANAMLNTRAQMLVSDVAARDVQAATSLANRIAHAGRKSWRFSCGGSGARGEAGAAKAMSFDDFPHRKPAVGKFQGDVPRQRAVGGHRCAVESPKAKPKSLRFAAERLAKRAAARTPRVFGCPNDRLWVTVRRVRLRRTALAEARCCASSGRRWKP